MARNYTGNSRNYNGNVGRKNRNLTVVKKTKEATVCRTDNGKTVTFLTPSGRCKRYGREISAGKNSRTGELLNDCAIGYRMGYRACLGEQAKIYNNLKTKK